MAWDVLSTTVSAAVPTGGTLTFAYPAGKTAGTYRGAYGQEMYVEGLQVRALCPVDFSISYGASVATVTWNGATAIPANTTCRLQSTYIGYLDEEQHRPTAANMRTQDFVLCFVDFGAVPTAVTNQYAAAQAVGAAGNLTLAAAANLINPVPVNVQMVSAGAGDTTQTATIFGLDEYGQVMTERLSMNGTTIVLGKKAFKSITRIAMSAATAGNISAGFGKVYGLPVYLPMAALVLRELQDGAIPTAGTIVAGDNSLPTSTTGDVRGTWSPNATPNGTITFSLILSIPSARYFGLTQSTT
jgi:hypothetical protein